MLVECLFAMFTKNIFLQGIRPAKEIPVTVPESPAFALKARLRSHVKDLSLEVRLFYSIFPCRQTTVIYFN